jgi:5-methyltetrahydrofolate--homocysteine methyltransferase
MENRDYLVEIKKNVILGHVDESDEGFDGEMEGTPGVVELVKNAIEQQVPVKEMFETLSAGMEIVGQKFESGEYLIPDMLASAECVGAAMDELGPLMLKEKMPQKGTIVIATVQDDIHDIGKNIVSTMLKGDGFDVKDLGTNVKTETIVDAVKEHNAEFLGLSALLTTTMVHMKGVIDALKSSGVRDSVKVLVGGAPTTPEFVDSIGADVHCKDAFEAIEKMKQFKSAA